MKNILLLLLCLEATRSFSQTTKPEFDGPGWTPPYSLKLDGWGIERFLIPMDFAPEIAYTGIEDVRFTKGWGDSTSNDYWSYAYLWFLDGKVAVNEKVITHNLELYYTGLVGRNIEKRNIPAEKVIATKATIRKTKTYSGDINTFSGSINMLDYMTQKPITLNCLIHHKTCSGQAKTFIFYEISPKSYTNDVWKNLNKLWSGFNCSVYRRHDKKT